MVYYNALSEGYNELYKEEQLNKVSIIKNNIKINKNTKILDIGCGTGISSGFECCVIGLEPSIELLKQNKNNRKLLGAAESLPFKDSSFDYVVSVTAMHNFKDIKKSINEMKRVGRQNFVLSILKRAKRFNFITKLIGKNFKIDKVIEEDKDTIFFCKTISFIYIK